MLKLKRKKIPGSAHFGFFIIWACLITFAALFLEDALSLSFETPWHLLRFFLPFILLIGFGIYIWERQRNIFWEMYNLSISDSLTGIYNHQFLRETLNELIEAHTKPLTIAFLDVDNFKEYNDNLGHLAGDSVLRAFSEILQKNLHGNEFAARYGGDEFIIVLNRDIESARKHIASALENFQRLTNLTASAGITQCKEGDTVDSILVRADKSMYRNKTRGKL